jgi:protein-S-isoprenylcysteine O-methyltransferase Ste14
LAGKTLLLEYAMLWIRGLIFTLLVPFMLGIVVPRWLDPGNGAADGYRVGWVFIAAGTLFYISSFVRFLVAGGTPTIYFARALRLVLGEEPKKVVQAGLYRFTRNPMYVGVITTILGQALLYGSWQVGLYGLLFGLWLHYMVTVIEEPHLRKLQGAVYEEYCRRVPRWFGRPGPSK